METFNSDSSDSDSVALTTPLTTPTPTPSLVKTSLKKAINTFYERNNTEFHRKDSAMP